MAKITMTKPSQSGIALGGIGAGSVELMPDGEFHYWQIANPPRLTRVCWENKADDGERHTGALSFWVRTARAEDGRPVVRKLGMRTEPDDFTYRLFPWSKPVEQIRFDGRFPVCELRYEDAAIPCRLTGRAVAPFVPHQTDVAATPGFYMDFEIVNTDTEPLTVSLLGTLVPEFCNDGGCRNTLLADGENVNITMCPQQKTDAPNCGEVSFHIGGDGEKSFIAGDYRRFIREYIFDDDAFGVSQESVLFGFRETGRLPGSEVGTPPPDIPEKTEAMSDEAVDALFSAYAEYPFAASVLRRIRVSKSAFPSNREDKTAFLACLRAQKRLVKKEEFGAAALCSTVCIAPGEKKTVRFILTWYFPNHFTADGRRLGHYYENLFNGATGANAFLRDHRADVFDKAAAFSQLLYDTDLPEVYPDCWSGHLNTIIKSSWYLKDGKFGMWEGQGFCGFHTTDITYHASFGLLALFPELQLGQMRMGAAFQREDGRVHHFFTPDLDHVGDGFDRVDMNNQFVLMVLRDYLYTGDADYLKAMWRHVIRAMDSIGALDSDGDGLPDRETKRNTYDAWNFAGTTVYISILWLAALKAAARIADEIGDAARAETWRDTLKKGLASLESRLWNGEYYDLWLSDAERDEGLMTDQLDGEWFLRVAGIGGNLCDDRIRAVARVILDHNFDPDSGLVNATCPEGRHTTLFTYKNCQTEAVWTGIGYAMAALCMSVGMRADADALVTAIHINQARFGALWDHWECGHHYTRPLSSWTTLNAALGLQVDGARRIIRLMPVAETIKLPLCLPGVLGTVEVRNGAASVRISEGNLDGWTVLVGKAAHRA